MQTDKIRCVKCGVLDIHKVTYIGRQLKIMTTEGMTSGRCVYVSTTNIDKDEFLEVQCGICGYVHLEDVETQAHNDGKFMK